MEVIPAGWADHVVPTSRMRTRVYFVVYAQLDEQKLKSALDQLLRCHWRKLGGRLVPNPKSGRLEYHVPHTFAEDYEVFKWSSSRSDEKVPVPDPANTVSPSTISLHPAAGELCHNFTPEDWPLSFQPTARDEPLLWVHLSFFFDATVVGMNIPHAVSDQLGLASLIEAWIGLITGQEPPRPLEVSDEDVQSSDEQRLAQVQRKGQMRVFTKWEEICRTLGFIREIVSDPKDVVHSIFVPMSLVEELFYRCKKDSENANKADIGLTKGDVVSAIMMKMSLLRMKDPKKIHYFLAINIRGRVKHLPRDKVFCHNACVFGGALFVANRDTPLAEFARQHRQSIINGLDPEVLTTSQAVVREYGRRKQTLILCEPGYRMSHVTNWTAAWRGIDFSPAVKGASETESSVRMIVLGQSREPGVPIHRFDSQIMCKTPEGYWCNFGAGSKAMNTAKEFLSKNPYFEDDVTCWPDNQSNGIGTLTMSIIVVFVAIMWAGYILF